MNIAAELPFAFAAHHGVLLDGNTLVHQPGLTLAVLLELRRHLGAGLTLSPVSEQDFKQRLTHAYQRSEGEAQRVAEDMSVDVDLARLAEEIPASSELMDGDDDAPVIRLINAILSQAVREKASDIHIEPYEEKLLVRFRIDGVLTEVLTPKLVLAPLLVSRIKVMARMDIAEKRLPQDGRISVKLAGHAIDIRVSTIPSTEGERVVLRLLDQQAGQLQLPQLAMPAPVLEGFTRSLAKPHGIILVTGPTGSGKSTSLYAGLCHLNDASRNILTIEDPVEYRLPGIGQTQVNPRVDMTFARGLRAILRQDPDVVMVGEIRDAETAAIAVQASLTGHLVLSTLHTNTAVGAITRLRDMGVEPFLLSSSLLALMAQRLVRLLCEHCKQPTTPTNCESDSCHLPADCVIYRPVGCEHCKQTGYRGRRGIYELIEIDPALARLIHENAAEHHLLEYCRRSHADISAHGRARVLAGETSLEEVLRVTAAG